MASRVSLEGIREAIVGSTPIKRLSVSNFACSLCEIQGLYRKMKIHAPRSEQQQMALDKGTAFHSKLDTDALPEVTPRVPLSPALRYASELFNLEHRWSQLAEGRSTREVPVFGTYRGIDLFGVIDGLESYNKKFRLVENKTFRRAVENYKLRMAYHQTLTYHYLYNQMMSAHFDLGKFVVRSQYDENVPLAPDDETWELLASHLPRNFTLKHVYNDVFHAFDCLQSANISLDSSIILRYSPINDRAMKPSQYVFRFDQETLDELMEFRAGLWLGDREPIPQRIEDGALSCKFCEYRNMCEFTRRAKDVSLSQSMT